MRLRQLRPYWLATGVGNCVAIAPGAPVVLTGPNGGGKSTMLRSIAAAALLAQCGLLVPCEEAIIPSYSHVYLRSGAMDCAAERRSSFAAEMCDLRTMLTAEGDTLLLIDEPCRGTATADGVSLLEAVLRHVPSRATCVCTTHFHELQAPHCLWKQLTARVDGSTAECTPDFQLVDGRCERSLALHVALAAGMPVDIVRAARREHDEETLVLSALYAPGEVHPHASIPPATAVARLVGVRADDFERRLRWRERQHRRAAPTTRARQGIRRIVHAAGCPQDSRPRDRNQAHP